MLFASNFDPELFVPLGAILLSSIVAISIVAISQWKKVRIAEMEATLKQQMIDRGMSADEIVRVLSASAGKSPPA
jgi:hypothetical protein